MKLGSEYLNEYLYHCFSSGSREVTCWEGVLSKDVSWLVELSLAAKEKEPAPLKSLASKKIYFELPHETLEYILTMHFSQSPPKLDADEKPVIEPRYFPQNDLWSLKHVPPSETIPCTNCKLVTNIAVIILEKVHFVTWSSIQKLGLPLSISKYIYIPGNVDTKSKIATQNASRLRVTCGASPTFVIRNEVLYSEFEDEKKEVSCLLKST